MKLKVHTLLLGFFVLITSCTNNKKGNISIADDSSVKKININSSDITKEEIGGFLTLDSYIILSNEEIIGEIERTIMTGEKIYLMDNTQRIFCYDMRGKMVFKIDRRGQGPGEYNHIADYSIDPISSRLLIYDDHLRKILICDLHTGDYNSEFSIRYMFPDKFGIADRHFFFHSSDDRRVVDKDNQRFYLLYSETGEQIDNCFLPHDAVSEFHFDLGADHPFFYNEGKLLYNKAFDSRIYLLGKDSITPLYDIFLPNQLPMKKIEEKVEYWDIVRSDYSYGMADIFISRTILYFTFSKDGFINSCYYDLEKDKILFCGPRVLANARKELPFYSLIKGVFNGKFYAFISPAEIERRKEGNHELLPEDLNSIMPEDNYIIAFYKIIQ